MSNLEQTKKQNKIEQKTSRVNPYSIKGPTDGDFIELGYNGKVEYQSIQTDNSFVRTLKNEFCRLKISVLSRYRLISQ